MNFDLFHINHFATSKFLSSDLIFLNSVCRSVEAEIQGSSCFHSRLSVLQIGNFSHASGRLCLQTSNYRPKSQCLTIYWPFKKSNQLFPTKRLSVGSLQMSIVRAKGKRKKEKEKNWKVTWSNEPFYSSWHDKQASCIFWMMDCANFDPETFIFALKIISPTAFK